MTPLETLNAARQIISDPAKWTQGVQARDEHGEQVPHNDPAAHSFCIMGAVNRVNLPWKNSDALWALSKITRRDFAASVPEFNDTHTHAKILALFDAAIAELEGVQS